MADYFMPGVAAALGVGISFFLQSRRNRKVNERVEPVLRAKGSMVLHALAEELGMNTFLGRGRVVLALNELVLSGKVRQTEAPEGTPQLEKVKHIKYTWVNS
jgi:hypothetical protein